MSETTFIEGHTCRYHSDYKGWQIYRAIDGGQPRMCYFGVGITENGGLTTVTARNLSGIKQKITEVLRMADKFQLTGFAIVGEFTDPIESMDSLLEAIHDIEEDLCAVLMENGFRTKKIAILGGKLMEESE